MGNSLKKPDFADAQGGRWVGKKKVSVDKLSEEERAKVEEALSDDAKQELRAQGIARTSAQHGHWGDRGPLPEEAREAVEAAKSPEAVARREQHTQAQHDLSGGHW